MNKYKPWISRHFYFFLTLFVFCAVLLFLPGKAAADEPEDDTVIFTLHAGDNGYFNGDPEIKTVESVQTLGQPLSLGVVPEAVDDTLTFMGWAADPNATSITILDGQTIVDDLITRDLYAIWIDSVEVTYYIEDGYVVTDEGTADTYIGNYPVGSNFDVIIPEPYSEQLYFEGWYSRSYGKGDKYTEDTVLDQISYKAFAYWKPVLDNIDPLELDKEYDFELESGLWYYSFTPSETGIYEFVTWDAVTEGPQAYVELLDTDRNRIAIAISTDLEGDVSLSHELTAGTTYLFELSEFSHQPITFNFKIHRPETAVVTFHANLEDGLAYFDDDPSKTSKEIEIMVGNDIHGYTGSGLNVIMENCDFMGWSKDPEAELPDDTLFVDGDIDVYAVYRKLNVIVLDAGDGHFIGGEDKIDMHYIDGEVFVADFSEPVIDDETRSFSGWATTPDATEPDIFEYVDMCEDLPDTIYAVYGEAITVTYDADGGYFFYNPDLTVQVYTRGKGHVFYGLTVNHLDPNYSSLGWKDQYGVEIPYTPQSVYPYYQTFEDTVFTPIWARYVIVNANGGYLPWDKDKTEMAGWLRVDKPFSNQDLVDLGIFPLNDDHLYYSTGWATDPELTEPDIIEGEAVVADLPHRIYAVWKEDSYYLDKGEGGSWEKGSDDELEFVVKRTGDDTETFRTFTEILVDGVKVDYLAPGSTEEERIPNYKASDKYDESLYLTLNPVYLETLEAGTHTLTVVFDKDLSREVTVTASFSVAEAPEVHEYGADGFCVDCGQFIFTDVTDPTKQKYVSWAYENEIVKGTGANSFSPKASCNRIQFIRMLWKMHGSDVIEGTNPFTDISGKQTINAVVWALDKGIINSGKKFNPNGEISRSQIVMILWKLAGSPAVKDVDNPFTDVTTSKLTKAVKWAYSSKVVKGTSETTFSPDKPCTRQQLVTLLYKYNKLMKVI